MQKELCRKKYMKDADNAVKAMGNIYGKYLWEICEKHQTN